MGRFNEIAKIYDNIYPKLRNPEMWEKSLKRISSFWKLSYCEALLLTEQNPNATMCATITQWNNVGRIIHRGERSVAVFKHRADTNLTYLFDISQTYGVAFGKKWTMSEKLADALVAMFNDAEGKENYLSLEEFLQKSLDKETETVYNYSSKLIGAVENQRLAEFIRRSAECICMTRCGIDKSYDFKDIANVSGDLSIVEIGNAATEIAQNVLQPIEVAIRRKKYEQYRTEDGIRPLRYSLRRGQGRASEPDIRGLRTQADDGVGEESGRPDERNRPDGSGYDKYERTVSDDMERNRGESRERSGNDREQSPEADEAQHGLQRTGDAAGNDKSSSGSGSVGNAENVRELAVSGSAPSEDVDGDWENSSEYYKYGGVIDDINYSAEEYNSEEASSDDTEDAFFISSKESDNDEQISLFNNNEDSKPITITCEWSESAVFEEGKTYSVLEFDTLMKRADSEWIEKRQQEIDKYGNDFDKVYEAYKNGEIERVHLGYAKTKFTVNLPNGNSISERQDIGDGYGGVIDFLSQYQKYASVVELLRSAVETELAEQQEREDNPYVYDGSMSIEDSRKAADAYNLSNLMNDYSDELKLAASSRSKEEFRDYYEKLAAKALGEYALNHDELWYKDMLDNLEYLKEVCNLVSVSLYNDILSEIQQQYPVIYVNGTFNRDFNVADVGFEVNKPYTVEEFNAALKKANELYAADERFEDKLYEVSVSVFASEDRAATFKFEIYAEYHSIGDIMDTKQSIADTQTLSELKSAISAIEGKTLGTHSDEIPADIDKFYVNPETEQVTWIYYNPDSSAGGQFVHTYFDFDDILEASEKDNPLNYLLETSKQTVLDKGMESFDGVAEEFMTDSEDISSRDNDYLDKLIALTEPRFAIYQLKDGEDLRDYRFSNSEYLRKHGMYIDRENYDRVYRGRLREGETLDSLYQRFNVNHPEDFRGHSLSVSDIICIDKNGTTSAYYVDSIGFTQVPDFTLSREERNARRALTDNLSLEIKPEEDNLTGQINLFGDTMSQEYSAAPQNTPFTSSNSSFVSQDMIDCVLRCGSNEPHSLERIISQYQKHKGIDSNADFLRKEFGTNARGIDFGQTTGSPYNRITAWYDENGITIGLGSKVQNNYAKASITWEQAAERIEQLLVEGNYAEQVIIDDAEAYTRKAVADNLWYLHQDTNDGVEYFIPDNFFDGGFPESTEKISEALKEEKPVSDFIGGLTDLIKRYEADPSIMRFNFHKMPEILESLKDLQLERREFKAEKGFEFSPVFFISEEEKDLQLIEGTGVEGGKFRIEEFFSNPHTTKEKADFLKDEYGIGGTGRSGYDAWHDAKGLVLKKSGFGDTEAVAEMKWNEVADRISRLIAQKRYITDKDIQNRIRSARWYINSGNEQQIEQAKHVLAKYGADIEEPSEPVPKTAITETDGAKITEKKIDEVRHETAPVNYRIPADFEYPTGAKAKYAANIAAIKTLKHIEAEHRNATPEEQDILAQYSGWGGVSDAFDRTKENWKKEYAELNELLTSKEYAAAKESTLTAFYTEPYIIKSIYNALENFGFEGGDILDPAMGTGNFFGNLPEKMAENSRLYGVELDSITARIAKQLYPNANIQNKGYERVKFEDSKFDVIVGNVPFGNYSPYDNDYDQDYLIHDYFIVKSLDKLKAGGILAFITSSGTMEKRDETLRRTLYGKANFVGGIRLPNDAFKTAGTQTVTDILFFQKLGKERTNSSEWQDEAFLHVYYNNGYFQNQYFNLNNDMILGRNEIVSGRYGAGTTVISDGNTEKKLQEAVSKLSCTFSAEPTIGEFPEEDDSAEDIPEDIQPYTYYLRGGNLYYAENRNGVQVEEGKNTDRIKAICGIFEQYDKLFAAQKNNCPDSELRELQSELNDVYDRFVRQYGYLNRPTNVSAFRDDVRAPKLGAIENVEESPDGTITYHKSDIFTQRVINTKQTPTHVDTALEALHISLNLRQTVDLEYISQLCGLDKDKVISELGDRIYCNPAKNTGGEYSGWETAEEYLSGYVRSKLELAEEAAKENPMFERNVSALLENQPPRIDITNIGFRLGTIYIPTDYVQQFIYETFETPQWRRASKDNSFSSATIGVAYSDELNEWKITNASSEKNSVLVTQTFGTSRLNAYQLTELTLNQKRAEVNDYRENSDGKIEKIFNAKETILARECQDKIEQAFHDWIMADKNRVETIENLFNDRYNNIKPRTFDGSYIDIEGMNPNLTLRPHQKNVIARIAATGTCMMAHEVGAGKTAAMGAAGMYLKSIGVCHKPMYVVPNAVVGQFAEELQRFFPEAKILAATAKDMEKSQRRRFLSKISVGNYDAIIIPQSQFETIPLSLERQEDMYNQKLSEISVALQLAKEDKGERFTVKALARQQKQLEKKIEKLRADFKKDDFITFEDLGCDFLFVDEAHNYKNLAVFSKMNNVAGVNTSQNSQKAFDMEMKCRYLQELHNGGGVVFATGTPISNSITELFVWQYLLQKQRLEDMRIAYFDNWASVYGVISQSLEIKPSGDGFRMRTRFSNFVNLPELCNLFGEVFDIAKTADMNLQLPQVKGGKPEMIICEKSPEQEAQTEIGIERARLIEAKLVNPREDNMLAICTYMTKVALDARILEPEAEEFDGGKVALCADKIIEINQDNPDMAQAVFCDTNTPKKDTFSVYQALKDRLVRSGKFSEKEIAFVHDAASDKQRLDLFEKVNNAQIKVIIGSTGKLGTGVNIQQRLIALHHLDAPYRPSDIEQRNGRGVRQGNVNSEVYIGYYSTKGTFDNYRWQLLEKKQQIISQIMSGKPAARSCEDVDEVALTFSEMKAATTGNPLLAEKMTVDNEVNRLRLLRNSHYQQQTKFEQDVNERYPSIIAKKEAALARVQRDMAHINSNPADIKEHFQITLNGKLFDERSEAGKALESIILSFISQTNRDITEKEIGEFYGFKLSAVHEGIAVRLRLERSARYYSDYTSSGSGGITRICNLYERIPDQVKVIQRELDEARSQLENASQQLGKPFPHEQQLKDLLERQSHINSELEFKEAGEEIMGDGEEEGEEDMEM